MKASGVERTGRKRLRYTSAELTLDIVVEDAMPSLAVYLSHSAERERLTVASTQLVGQPIQAALIFLGVPHFIE